MIGLDTNILLRYFARDDETQNEIVDNIISPYIGERSIFFVNNIVICELVWVLEAAYKYSKEQVTSIIKEMLAIQEFCFEDYQNIWLSILEYEESKADISDILLGKTNRKYGCKYTLSFDKATKTLQDFSYVGRT